MKAIMYGAGSVGRGFIGQLFSQSGYKVVFIDVNTKIVNKLNEDNSYPIKIVTGEKTNEIIINNVRAINGRDINLASDEIAGADIMATAVGVNILPQIAPIIGIALKKRWAANNMQPFNIIICENMLDAGEHLRSLIFKDFSTREKQLFQNTIGLVEASIGRMIPVMTEEMQEGNVLKILVEEYCELPVNRDGFKGSIPQIKNMVAFSPFKFYLHRKLFIHNLGHVITAYLGNLKGYSYIWESIEDNDIKKIAIGAMQDSAKALSLEHNFPLAPLIEHVNDLIKRFGNKYLGDTIERVGKDPVRKLSYEDRLVGAARLCKKQGITPFYACQGIAAALFFSFEKDSSSMHVQNMIKENGPLYVLEEICHIDKSDILAHLILRYYNHFKEQLPLRHR